MHGNAMRLERTPGRNRKTSGGKGGKGGNLLAPSGASDFVNDINHSRRALRAAGLPRPARRQPGANRRKLAEPPCRNSARQLSAFPCLAFGVHSNDQ